MYKIVSFRFESAIKKNFARRRFFAPPPHHKSVPTALVTWNGIRLTIDGSLVITKNLPFT